jgi:hypothetical protein
MYTQNGTCNKCGAATYVPTIWNSVLPPPTHYSCNCYFTAPKTFYTLNTTSNQLKFTPPPLQTSFPPYDKDEKQKALDDLFEHFEDNDIAPTTWTPEKLLRRMKKLENVVEELVKKVDSLTKENEKIKSIKKILND